MTKKTLLTLKKPMGPRDSGEGHRAATPLELLFDLVSVIAIAAAVAGLHHAISANHAIEGLISYVLAFFAIWWAWMNYTWFASAYDNDDAVFRLLSMMAMAGSLVVATGIARLFDTSDPTVVVAGYIIMRLAMVALWLRAARHDQAGRKTALTYAIGIALAQVYWVGLLFVLPLDPTWFYALFVLGIIFELTVPVMAERHGNTPWHKGHITERYGLLFIIVMGELLLGATLALKAAYSETLDATLISIAVASLLITFSMWWLYFCREDHLEDRTFSRALLWGYGHVVIFSSAAAVGGGLAVLVDVATDHAKVGLIAGAQAVAVPLALYLVSLWFVRDRFVLSGPARFVLPVFAILVLAAPFGPYPLELITALSVLCVMTRNILVGQSVAEAG